MDNVCCLKEATSRCQPSNSHLFKCFFIATLTTVGLLMICIAYIKKEGVLQQAGSVSGKRRATSLRATTLRATTLRATTLRSTSSRATSPAVRALNAEIPQRKADNVSLRAAGPYKPRVHTALVSNPEEMTLESNPLHQKYLAQLRSVLRLQYNPSQTFIQYGKPVASVQPPHPNKIKLILTWTPFEGETDWIPKVISCPGNVTCIGTHDTSDLLLSDAVVIHPRDLSGRTLPSIRLPHQRWIHHIIESPHFSWMNATALNGIFNWTSTFRRDTDAPAAYMTLYKRTNPLSELEFDKVFTELYSSKTKLVSHMNSNCWTPHTNRLAYVAELQQYIRVDTYGGCGVLKCPRETAECEATMKQYKFYMAMENSNCRDYITEKVAQPLFLWGAVPVVMGGADPGDYERLLPPGSYIHTSGFSSPEELAKYLKLLDKNPSLYKQYHRWRTNFTGRVNSAGKAGTVAQQEFWCNICTKLYDMSLPVQWYRDFNGWQQQDSCHADPLLKRPI